MMAKLPTVTIRRRAVALVLLRSPGLWLHPLRCLRALASPPSVRLTAGKGWLEVTQGRERWVVPVTATRVP